MFNFFKNFIPNNSKWELIKIQNEIILKQESFIELKTEIISNYEDLFENQKNIIKLLKEKDQIHLDQIKQLEKKLNHRPLTTVY